MQTQDLQRPLDRGELAELTAFFTTTPGVMPFHQARGFLTAIGSAPTTLAPSAWQPAVFGERGFASMEQAKHVFGLVLRLYNQILTALEKRAPVAPSDLDDEATRQWCAGYLLAANADDVWIADERGYGLLFPVIVLAGDVDLVGEEDADGNVIEDPTPQLQACRAGLDAAAHDANGYWTAWRRKQQAGPVASRAPKVGRNEGCPCGSGRKYKKCCALTAN